MTALWQVSNDARHWFGAVALSEGPDSSWAPDIWRTATLTKGRGTVAVKFWRPLPSVVTPAFLPCVRAFTGGVMSDEYRVHICGNPSFDMFTCLACHPEKAPKEPPVRQDPF